MTFSKAGKRDAALLARMDLGPSRVHFERACALSREYDHQLDKALMLHGSHGAQVSGAGRAHFPEAVKRNLREIARLIAAETSHAYASKLARIHVSTIRALGCAVAARDGSGFYGPQP